MQTKVKVNTQVTARIIDEHCLGFTVKGFPERVFDRRKVHPANIAYAEIHGWGQRIPDKAAINKDDGKGNIIPESERLRMKDEGIQAVIAHYESGSPEWNMRGGSASRMAAVDHALTIEAVALVQGVTHEAVNKYISDTATRMNVSRTAVLDTLAGTERFAVKIAELRRARVVKAAVNEEELLAGLPVAS